MTEEKQAEPIAFNTENYRFPLGSEAWDVATKNKYQEQYAQYEDLCLKLNADIGWHWWKRYVAAAFWGNMSTPVNLGITVLTAATTAQTASQDLLDKATSLKLGAVALGLSTVNTFFRPHEQLNSHLALMKEWAKFGTELETAYYKPDDTLEQLQAKVSDCYELCARINSYKITRSYSNNFLTDLIHIAAYYCCLSKSRDHWISDMSREFTNKRNIIVGGDGCE